MRCLLIDDHPLIADAVAGLLRQLQPDAELQALPDCERGLAWAAAHGEPALLLDLGLPGLRGLDALRCWRERHPALPIAVLSAEQQPGTALAVLDAGAAAFPPKSLPPAQLRDALRLVLDGGRYAPPQLLLQATPADPLAALGLTARQRDVLRLVTRGVPNKTIARELRLAEHTVKAHVTALLRALNCSSRTQLALVAARLGLKP
ncbi:MAG: LuxR C-terminal-related transcriptional regulator [Roseateles sp.]